MQPVISFTLRQKVFFNLMFILLIVAGAFSVMQMPVERFPAVTFNLALINTLYPGASAGDVETLITREIESALDELEEVEFYESRSIQGLSTITVKFMDDVDYAVRFDELRFKILTIQGQFPQGAEPPFFELVDIGEQLPVCVVNLAGDRSNRSLTLMAKELKPALEKIPGVKKIILDGEQQRELHIQLDPYALSRAGITFEEVATALQSANMSLPAGRFRDETGSFLVRVDEKFRTKEQVLQTVVRTDLDGSFVTMADLVDSIDIGYRDPSLITSVNGQDAVSLKVVKTSSGNALSIKEEVDRVLAGFAGVAERESVSLIITQDSTTYIGDSVSTLGRNMLAGIILVAIIIWFFMGFRNACLTTLGIPFAFLVTMTLMWVTGNSINELTIFAFILVSGIVVDDAIVVVENIYRHVQAGEELHRAVITGTSEVILPVISATATTVAAFLPMLIMTGPIGEFFALIPKAVTFALVASLIECIFIFPLHYLDWGRRMDDEPSAETNRGYEKRLMDFFMRHTEKIIDLTTRFRWSSLGILSVLFLLALGILGVSISGLVPLMKIKFFPDDYNTYFISIESGAYTDIETSSDRAKAISEFIMADGPGKVASCGAFAGFTVTEDETTLTGDNYAILMVALPEKSRWEFTDPLEHLDDVRRRIKEQFETAEVKIQVKAAKTGPPTGKDISVHVTGSNEQSVHGLAKEIMDLLTRSEEIAGELIQLDSGVPRSSRTYQLTVNHKKVHEYGLSSSQATLLAGSVLDGRYTGKFRLADEEVDIKLTVSKQYLKNATDSLDIPVLEDPSGPVTLRELVVPSIYSTPSVLTRYNGQRSQTVSASIRPGSSLSSPVVINRIDTLYEQVREKYPGATLIYGGAFEDTNRSYTSLAYAFIIAIILMYIILATQFSSYLQPVIIISTVIFALTGVIWGKFLTQSVFTVNSFIAIIGVAGVVVNDSLMLIDFINKGYASGLSRTEAIRRGIRMRLRPILLTTFTTTLGLLPMALGIPSYSPVWGSMASTFVTGLVTAGFFTLFIIPLEWDLLMEFRDRWQAGIIQQKARHLLSNRFAWQKREVLAENMLLLTKKLYDWWKTRLSCLIKKAAEMLQSIKRRKK